MPEALSVFTVPCLLTSPCFGFRQNVPLLAKERDVAKRQGEVAIPSPCEGKGPEGELCHSYLVMPSAASTLPRFVMLSAAKHPCCGFLTGVWNDAFGSVMLSAAKHP